MRSRQLGHLALTAVWTGVAVLAASCGPHGAHGNPGIPTAEAVHTGETRATAGTVKAGAPSAPKSTAAAAEATAPPESATLIAGGTPLLPADVVAAVADVVGAPSFLEARRATETLLMRSGIGLQGAGARPSGVLQLSPAQIDAVARDARLRRSASRTTLSEYVATLQKLGAPLPADHPADLAFQAFLADWTRAAIAAPGDPQSAPLLYLAALARRQNPPIDLAAGDYDPEQLHLGFLDLNLLAAALAQLAPGFGLTAPGATPVGPVARAWDGLQNALVPTAYAADAGTPCTKLKDDLKQNVPLAGFGGEAGAFTAGQAVSKVIEQGVASYTKYMVDDPAAAAKAFGEMLNKVGILMKVQALLELYAHSSVTAEILSANPIHQPGEHDAERLSAVKVSAGVADDEWSRYKQNEQQHGDPMLDALKDCAGFAGLPTWTGEGDIAGQVKNWLVHWSIEGGAGTVEYADPTHMDFPGSFRNFLKPEGDHRGVDTLPVRVLPEHDANHPGELVHVPVTIRAEVATDQPPSPGGLAGLVAGGPEGIPLALAAVLADVLTGWWQALDTLDASVALDVTHHELHEGRWHGVIEVESWFEDSSAESSHSDFHGSHPADGAVLGGDYLDHSRERRTRTDRLVIRGVAQDHGKSGATLVAADAVQAAYAYAHLHDETSVTQVSGDPCAVTTTVREFTSGQGGASMQNAVVEINFSAAGARARIQSSPVASFPILAQSHTEVRAQGNAYCHRQNPDSADDHEAWSTEDSAGGPVGFALTADPKSPDHWQGSQRVV
ncbi:MAG TPA: hypothetical protein VFK80_01110, partial [Limnochordia bacterium]|nr:hypothetical protein [Limnochordia bacterium]